MYNFCATVNYPEQSEVDTPDFKANDIEEAVKLFRRLLTEENEATSFVVIVSKKI